ncbi:MAG: glutathione S-transferase N-terminal domain-containing protein [Rhodospirillales bacterium]
MFTLVTSVTSPYGRKARMVVDLLGLNDRMTLQHANTVDPEDPLLQINPLGKIPALIREDGQVIYDSRVIVDYLETTYGDGRIIPRDADTRFRQLTLAALAEGINDALLLIAYEKRFREPEQTSPVWLDRQYGKLERGFPAVVDSLDQFKAPLLSSVTLACALGYADWRQQIDWRARWPVLVDWLDEFRNAVPAYDRTAAETA